MMSPDLQRIQHIRDYCDEIRKTIQRYGADFAVFDQDADYQRSISFCILQIGELSGGLSEEYRKATSSRVQWGPMKGMRNLVAHNYGSMDREIIWETAMVDIPALKRFCDEQLTDKYSMAYHTSRPERSGLLFYYKIERKPLL